ncbi:hypothetical protein ABCS02_28100 [Microbacterium sp. X-17]|uniref:hypothetical protein n=1 Tax=Microbacterium sp. X-17 TaxID=3144404 RepID=UPI0031F4D037
MSLVELFDQITDREREKLDDALALDLPSEVKAEMLANIRDVAIWEALHAIAERLDRPSI